ncbi:polyisoprenoid-binding protein [Xylanimonas allomyrinae]|uniref:Polyisoprenoid-binding protein n=1 Tax=Xylanimonas allomyrinae TaxID=2509459 RepID=A0A4P6EQJ7_9MICO|nr:YceI family protein [Xylanimonas allomyrinae]QAY63699.1 polyisoprenoid-binding protein [Xylanimonas allomyrinae]
MTDLPLRTWNDLVIPAPGPYHLDTEHMRLGFNATHMMVSTVRGEFTRASAQVWVDEDPLESWASATIQSASIDTDNAERDGHLRSGDFLDADTHPTIGFRSTGLTWQTQPDPIFSWARLKGHAQGRTAAPDAATRPPSRFQLHGDLTIRSTTLPVTLDVEYGGARRDLYGRDIWGFSATTAIDREAYGLLWNVALEAGGVLVAKTVRLELAGEFIRSDGVTARP